jgi:hypothetical protein
VQGQLHTSRLDLSQAKSLRTLRFFASDFSNDRRALQSINALLLAVPPSSQLDVVIVYNGSEFCSTCATPEPDHVGSWKSIKNSSWRCHEWIGNLCLLKVLGSAYLSRSFRLVFSVEASEERAQLTMKVLELQLRIYQDGGLRSLLSGSSVIYTKPSFASGYI